MFGYLLHAHLPVIYHQGVLLCRPGVLLRDDSWLSNEHSLCRQ